jgi:hypothetical protein
MQGLIKSEGKKENYKDLAIYGRVVLKMCI